MRAAPLALFAALVSWIAIDLYRFAPLSGRLLGGVLLALGAFGALRKEDAFAWRRASRALLAVAFVGERTLAVGIDVVPMIAFLVLLMALASLHSLERTFGPVYEAVTDPSLLAKVDSAAVAAYARALGLFGFTFVTSLLLLSVIPLVAVPGRSLALVLGVALALLAVIAWLAISPSLPERRRG